MGTEFECKMNVYIVVRRLLTWEYSEERRLQSITMLTLPAY